MTECDSSYVWSGVWSCDWRSLDSVLGLQVWQTVLSSRSSAKRFPRSIFYFLLIFAAVVVVIITFYLPETLQKIAGDGSIPLSGIHRPLIQNFGKQKETLEEGKKHAETRRVTEPLSFKTFLESFKLLLEKDVFITLLFGSVVYAVWSMVTSSTSNLFKKEYKLSDVQIGLVFLPNGKYFSPLPPLHFCFSKTLY
jgi:hypothetical protein